MNVAKRNEQGSLVLLIEVDELGKVLNVTVKESSGFLLLDRAAADNARRHWFFDPTQAKTTYECPIVFVMQ